MTRERTVRAVTLAAACAMLTSTSAAAQQDSAWSAPVDGLRARLLVLTSSIAGPPFVGIHLELQNVRTGPRDTIRVWSDIVDRMLRLVAEDSAGVRYPTVMLNSFGKEGDTASARWRVFAPGQVVRMLLTDAAWVNYGQDLDRPSLRPLQYQMFDLMRGNETAAFLRGTFTPPLSPDPLAPGWYGTLVLPRIRVPRPP
jgi:hypothetical protein